MKKTKIIGTLGPASQDKKTVAAMTEAGMNVVRLNFSHGTHEDYAEKIRTIKEMTRHVNLGGNPVFNEHYMDQMFFPEA